MVETYLGYPVFVLQGVVSLIGTVVAGVLIGFFTTFYLKRKDETTRVAGVILEKRVDAQHQILNFLESSSQKLEMIQPLSASVRELLQDFDFELPYDPHIQYADIFTSIEKYREFFHGFEELLSEYRLWLDPKTRYQMFLMQEYFAAINATMLAFNRIPLPAGVHLSMKELKELSDQLLLMVGIVIDAEFNQLIMDLDVMMVRSIYKLNLARPKDSYLSNGFTNKEAKKAEQFLLKESVMGQALSKFVVLSLDLVEIKKGMGFTEAQSFEYFKRYSAT